MAETGFASFNTTVDKTNRILHLIEEAYGWPRERRNQSYAALRALLHTLRDRLTVEQAAQLAAQLPMLVRGIYYEGWEPHKVPVKMGREEFLERIRRECRFEAPGGVEPLIHTVLQALRAHITEGEWEDVRASVPKNLESVLT
ncbi:DUF2267 domain-containing protein [Actinopolymorpha alba]|uniref:DUF2267 domain-containing protein n=1 Tax=Actinopolymorpha alba TaxID=533267 RepID=UPI0003618CBB|nr:DUF2267 domain-containing protein [Actinopolymorpha alba]